MVKYFIGGKEYTPGAYAKKRPEAESVAQKYISDMEKGPERMRRSFSTVNIPPCICFSRKIGVGALEIADIVSSRTGLKVVDREILEHIATSNELSKKTIRAFDEKYPGRLKEVLSAIYGEKSFAGNEFARQLFSTVFSLAGMGSTIFVGRGTHLMLPRERVLAVRFIASKEFRTKRLAEALSVSEDEASPKLDQIDAEQKDYFKNIFNVDIASAYEFDMIINREHLRSTELAARLVETAFREKFGLPASGKTGE